MLWVTVGCLHYLACKLFWCSNKKKEKYSESIAEWKLLILVNQRFKKTLFVSPQLDIYTVVLCIAVSGVRLLSVSRCKPSGDVRRL